MQAHNNIFCLLKVTYRPSGPGTKQLQIILKMIWSNIYIVLYIVMDTPNVTCTCQYNKKYLILSYL